MAVKDAVLGLDIYSEKPMTLAKSIDINGITVNYELQCKSWWTGRYIYFLRADVPGDRNLTFYIITPLFGEAYCCAHMKDLLTPILLKYGSFLPEKIAKAYPALDEILCKHKYAYLDGTDLKMDIPGSDIRENSLKLKGVDLEAVEKFLSLLIQVILETNKLIANPVVNEGIPDEKRMLRFPFIGQRDLNLPLRAMAGNLEVRYACIRHKDAYHKDFFVCQIKVVDKFLTFFIKQKNMIDTVCRIVANKSTSIRIARDIIPPEDIIEIEKLYPGLCSVLYPRNSQLVADPDQLIMKTTSFTYMSGKGNTIPTEVLKRIPDFLRMLIQAEREAKLFAATTYYQKCRKHYLSKKKITNDTAAVGGVLVLARLALRFANLDLDLGGADNIDVSDVNLDTDFNLDASIDMEVQETTAGVNPELSTSSVSTPPGGDFNRMVFTDQSNDACMFKNPFDIGLNPSKMYAMGMIDSPTYDSMCDIERFFDQRRADMMAHHENLIEIISDDHQSTNDLSVDQMNQVKFDAADADQKEALRLRGEAFDRGDTDEFEKQTARARDLQYAKETYKDTPCYVSDIDIRAGLKKP